MQLIVIDQKLICISQHFPPKNTSRETHMKGRKKDGNKKQKVKVL